MSEKIESADGLPPPRLYVASAVEADPSAAAGKTTPPLSTQVRELTKELRAQLDETQKLLDRTRIR